MENIKITNPDKIIYPKDKIKKIDVVKYYAEISAYMLPFIENRLLSVLKCHSGVKGDCFFNKHPNSNDFIHIKKLKGDEYFYIKTQEEIVYQAQLGTLEFHTWGSEVTYINKPNIMVFDLDPDEKLDLKNLVDAVKKLKSILDDLNLVSFLKTSGGKGYHIVVPFSKSKNWDKFYEFSRKIAVLAENTWPDIFTTNIRKKDRVGKIFVDFLRNNKGSTCVAPYSLRARDGATISMPIAWKNLGKIKPNEVNINNYKKYLNNSWQDFFETTQEIK